MTTPTEFWTPGTQILWQYDWAGSPPFVDPMTVARDDAAGLVAWLAAGTEVRQTRRRDGRHLRAVKDEMFTTERVAFRTVWKHNDVLRIAPAGRAWSVWLMWDADSHEFRGWYGNIETPHQRQGTTTRTRDDTLDVVVTPDRHRRRKDEDELAIGMRTGWYSREDVARIHATADELEAVIDAWGWPFCDGWEGFAPDPAWPMPSLPADPVVPADRSLPGASAHRRP